MAACDCCRDAESNEKVVFGREQAPRNWTAHISLPSVEEAASQHALPPLMFSCCVTVTDAQQLEVLDVCS